MFGVSKIGALCRLCATWPYQVIPSRIQVIDSPPCCAIAPWPRCAVIQLGAGTLASPYDRVEHRAYMET